MRGVRLADRRPHRLGRRRHCYVFRTDGSGDRVHHRGGRRDRAGFAAALDAERVGRAFGHRRLDGEGRQIVGARHRVVHQRSGDELAVAIIDRAFQQRLADALRDAAVHLARDDHRIDDDAEVIDRHPLLDTGEPGLGIDLDLADVAARRKREVGGVVERTLLEAGLELRPDELVGDISLQRDVAPRRRFVGPGDGELAVLEDDVGLGRFEHMRGDLLRLGLDLVERLHDRRHADGTGA